MALAKVLQQKADSYNETLEKGQHFRNGNGITFKVIELNETTITLSPKELQNSGDSRLSRSVFCQLWARNNYEFVKNPDASREFALTKQLGLNRFAVK
jgi:hypothetical protein